MMAKFLNKFPLIPLSLKRTTIMLPLHSSLLSKELFETKKFAVGAPCLGYATYKRKFNVITPLKVYAWPNLFKIAKGFFLAKFVIKWYDPEFDLTEFSNLSKKAVGIVSGLITEGDYKSLDGLVTPDVIDEVREGVRCLNRKQFTHLCIRQEDIMYTFLHHIEFVDSEDDDSFIVDITMVYHVVHDLPGIRARFHTAHRPTSKELREIISIANYRFRRDFKKDPAQWIINGLNHMQPKPQ